MTTTTRRATTNAAPPPLDTDWRAYAACASVDPELFFPVGSKSQIRAWTDIAKQVCRRCPVRERCLEWALATDQRTGVWGGMGEAERRQLSGAPETHIDRCVNAQAWIEGQLAAGASRRKVAADLGVDRRTLDKALARFAEERAESGEVRAA